MKRLVAIIAVLLLSGEAHAWDLKADFGAQGDTVANNDGVTTANSNVLASNLASWVSTDAGKQLSVDVNSVAYSGTILSVTDAHHIVMSFTVPTAATKVAYHYGTNDRDALAAANSACVLGNSVITVPSGFYTIAGTATPLISGVPCRFIGQGSGHSIFWLDPAYVGDLFAGSEMWPWNTSLRTSIEEREGFGLEGISIWGDAHTTNNQNAVALYDRSDLVVFDDVVVNNVNGACLKIGYTKNISQAYTRESHFNDLYCFGAGTSSQPAVEVSSATASGSDATNEIRFYGLQIFAARGVGFSIHNPNPYSGTRQIYCIACRIEQSGADDVHIGESTDQGPTFNIGFYGTHTILPPSGHYGWVVASGASTSPYNIDIQTNEEGPGYGGAFNVQNGSVRIHSGGSSDSGTELTVAAGATVYFENGGNEAAITRNIATGATVLVPTTTSLH